MIFICNVWSDRKFQEITFINPTHDISCYLIVYRKYLKKFLISSTFGRQTPTHFQLTSSFFIIFISPFFSLYCHIVFTNISYLPWTNTLILQSLHTQPVRSSCYHVCFTLRLIVSLWSDIKARISVDFHHMMLTVPSLLAWTFYPLPTSNHKLSLCLTNQIPLYLAVCFFAYDELSKNICHSMTYPIKRKRKLTHELSLLTKFGTRPYFINSINQWFSTLFFIYSLFSIYFPAFKIV